MQRTLIASVIAVLLAAFLCGCQGYIAVNGGGGTLPAVENLVHDEDTVGDISWTEQPNTEEYHVTVTDDGTGEEWESDPPPDPCGADSTCDYTIPGLDRNKQYTVVVTYDDAEGESSEEASVGIDTSWKVKYREGPQPEKEFGMTIDVGRVAIDGVLRPAIIAGGRLGANTRPLLFVGPDLPAGDELEYYSQYQDVRDSFGNPVILGDVDCDGIDDVLLGSGAYAGVGAVYIYFGDQLAEGIVSAADARVSADLAETYFGQSFAAAHTDSTNCETLWIGAPRKRNAALEPQAGAVYRIYEPSGITSDIVVSDADIHFEGANSSDRAGMAVANLGILTADGLDKVIFSTETDTVGDTSTLSLRFSDQGSNWGDFVFVSNGTQAGTGGRLEGEGQFFFTGGLVSGARISFYDGRGSGIVPDAQLLNTVDDDYGVGVADGNVNQHTDGQELMVGLIDQIWVYNDFVLPGFSAPADEPDIVWADMPGYNMKLIDFNEDGYLDIVSADISVGGVITGNATGIVYLFY